MAKVKKITIELKKGKTVDLTLEEVRELHNELADLLNKPSHTTIIDRPYWPPQGYDWGGWTFHCTDNTITSNIN